jgi:hypothetical protein
MPFDPNINDGGRSYRPGEEEWAAKYAADRNNAEAARLASLGTANDDNSNSGTPNTSAQSAGNVNILSTGNSGQKTGKISDEQNIPGRRPFNPLSVYSSYSYSLTLYMVTPEFMNEFTAGPNAGTLPVNRVSSNQIFVVAQSGGINNGVDSRALTFSKALGPNQQGLDIYIDDLNLLTLLPGATNGQTIASDIRFKIIEPIGFSFLQDLTIASNRLNSLSSIAKSSTTKPLPIDQKYILSIRYYGYDVAGNITQSKSTNTNFSGFSDTSSAVERHLPIRLLNVKFKLDEKSTIYNIEAANASESIALSKSVGIVEKQTSISGSTIEDVLLGTSKGTVGLLQVINGNNQDKKDINKQVEIPNEYAIEFIGKDNPLAKSKLIDDKDFESRISKMSSTISKTDQSNISASYKATTVNVKDRSLSIAAGTPIVQAIDNIIVKSDFVTSALTKVNTGKPESKTVQNSANKPLQWYSINPVVTVKGMDKKTNQWAYKITYQIGIYDVPYIRSPYVNSKVKYGGPFKYYEYFLTGQNTEVLEYEQVYDNLYQISAGKTTGPNPIDPDKIKKLDGVPLNTQPPNTSPVGGKLIKGSEINESVKAVLYSPSDRQSAKIRILGDPDYIMSAVGVKQNNASFSSLTTKIYGPDNSINPNGGQVFIQILFNTASDYQNNGLLDVSDKIQFYESSAVSDAGIKGVVYQVLTVESTFNKGVFTQTLDCFLIDSSQLLRDSGSASDTQRSESNQNTVTTSGRTTTSNPSTKKYDIRSPTFISDEDADIAALSASQALAQPANFDYSSGAPTANDDQTPPPATPSTKNNNSYFLNSPSVRSITSQQNQNGRE